MATIEDYVSFAVSKLLEEKGFDSVCNGYYNQEKVLERVSLCSVKDTFKSPFYFDCVPAPTLQMAMRWLREIHGYVIVVEPGLSEDKYVWTYKVIFYRTRTMLLQHEDNVGSLTYEESCETAIKYCLENLI